MTIRKVEMATRKKEKTKYQHEMRGKKISIIKLAKMRDHKITFRFFFSETKAYTHTHTHSRSRTHLNEIQPIYSFSLSNLPMRKKNHMKHKLSSLYFENIAVSVCFVCWCCYCFLFPSFFSFQTRNKNYYHCLLCWSALCMRLTKKKTQTDSLLYQTERGNFVCLFVQRKGVLSQKLKHILNGIGMPACAV